MAENWTEELGIKSQPLDHDLFPGAFRKTDVASLCAKRDAPTAGFAHANISEYMWILRDPSGNVFGFTLPAKIPFIRSRM